jgi:putative ATP-dependent endonuclease of OLD family
LLYYNQKELFLFHLNPNKNFLYNYDNITIVRVDRGNNNSIKCTTLYRPNVASLSDNDKGNLKLLNICDPYVHEFFFGGRIIVVEGDTEFTVFSWLKSEYLDLYNDVHIIRARGKATIPSVIKILNQFTCDYAVLHDTDTPKISNGNNNPAWTINQSILDEVNKNNNSNEIRLIACKTDFESALLGGSESRDKPYNAIKKIKEDQNIKYNIKSLFDSLLSSGNESPTNCIKWNSIEQIK